MGIRGLFMEIRVYKRETNLSQILNKSIFTRIIMNWPQIIMNWPQIIGNYN